MGLPIVSVSCSPSSSEDPIHEKTLFEKFAPTTPSTQGGPVEGPFEGGQVKSYPADSRGESFLGKASFFDGPP